MLRYSLSLLFLFVIALPVNAQAPVSKSFFNGVAIGGQDTVAYFSPASRQSGQSVEGDKSFASQWLGAIWYFANAADRDKFAANPAAYTPEFNGHCANALSLGEGLIKTNGQTWQFFGDQLFLFYAPRGLTRWQDGNVEAYLATARQNWLRLSAP
ncbi:YHS domain-containing (seleno)protein [Reinekea sp.]|jgi:YHS domain-containing protein|uniref:YHS domain-containing (seleno)protein n=1 Tax=Reinekea sp. TaxID=1970455 RepID=UPI002A82426D|nr:YHS domain-containing (seleno)protein [Reinekea sp.]